MKRLWLLVVGCLTLSIILGSASPANALSARLRYDALLSSKEPYQNANNEKASLAWGASYQLMSYVVMLEATGDETYLDRAAKLIDIIWKQRDDKRGVKDFRGVSAACWRNLHYQPKQQPYCYVVHSGMLTYPAALWVVWVYANKTVGQRKAYDQKTYKDKADDYLKRIEETIKAHDDQWKSKGSSQGYYIFRTQATFLAFSGKAMPLNQQNALGRTLAVVARVTGKSHYVDKTRRLCTYFKAYTKLSGRGLVWNYWPTTYKSPGEDISHGAINSSFAVECFKSKAAFSKSDLIRIGYALFDNSYISATSWRGFIGGGAIKANYAQQVGRWLSLSEYWPVLYGPIRSYYDLTFATTKSASGSLLLSFAYLAAYEPRVTHHDFYYVDWSNTASYKQATAYGANLIALPLDTKAPWLVKVTYASYGALEFQQWDGKAYHTIQKFPNTAGKSRAEWFVFDPRHWHAYYKGHALFQFKDASFVKGKGVKVWKPTTLTPPSITSKPSVQAIVGRPYAYNTTKQATGKGSQPFMWKALSPKGLTIYPTTGVIAWTPSSPGTYQGEIQLTNDTGSTRQRWTLSAVPPLPPEPAPEPAKEPVPESSVESVKEPFPEQVAEPGSEPALEPSKELSSEPMPEPGREVVRPDASVTPEPNPTETLVENVPENTSTESAPTEQMKEVSAESAAPEFIPEYGNVEPMVDSPSHGPEDKSSKDATPNDTNVGEQPTPETEDGVDASISTDTVATEPQAGCGCSSQHPSSIWTGFLFILLVLVLLRRREGSYLG